MYLLLISLNLGAFIVSSNNFRKSASYEICFITKSSGGQWVAECMMEMFIRLFVFLLGKVESSNT